MHKKKILKSILSVKNSEKDFVRQNSEPEILNNMQRVFISVSKLCRFCTRVFVCLCISIRMRSELSRSINADAVAHIGKIAKL